MSTSELARSNKRLAYALAGRVLCDFAQAGIAAFRNPRIVITHGTRPDPSVQTERRPPRDDNSYISLERRQGGRLLARLDGGRREL